MRVHEPEVSAFPEFNLPYGVEHIPGEPLRFLVQSRTRRNMKHLVDLEECGFNGACSCENFQMRLLPRLRAERSAAHRRHHRCEHIRRAMEFNSEIYTRIVARKILREAEQNKLEARTYYRSRYDGAPSR